MVGNMIGLSAALMAVGGDGALPSTIDRLVVRASGQADRQTAPVSLAVLDGNPVVRLAPRAPAELLNRAASVFVQAGSGREHLTAIRSPVLTGGAGAGSFLFLQDGVPLRAPGFANVNGLFHASFPFAARVEVLRGPGDVAYGSNALHGAINVVTGQPGEGGSSALVSYGAFDRYRARGTLSGERSTLGLSILDDGGYRAQSGALEIKGHGSLAIGGGVLRGGFHKLEQETAGFVIGNDAFRDDALRRSNPNPEAFRDVRHGLVSWSRPLAMGAWRGTVTPFARWTDMAFLQHFLPGDALEENEHTSLGLQSLMARPLGKATDLVLGFDVDATDGALREFQDQPTIFSFTQGLHYDYRVQALEAAPFAKLSRQVSPSLKLEGGLRATFTRYRYDNDAPTGVVGRFKRVADREDRFTALTAKLAGTYRVNQGHSVYLSLARGARPPQTTDLYRLQRNQDIEGIEPETLDSLELGWRASFAGESRLSLTGFAMRKRRVFFRDADGFNVTDGETNHIGAEAEGVWRVSDQLALRFGGTWSAHTYGFDRDVGNRSEVIKRGNDVDTAPRTLANAQLTWTPSPAWRGEAAITHVGRYAMNAANTAFYDGHDRLDLRLQRQWPNAVSVTAILRNALDARYARRADFAFGQERYFPGEERALEVVMAARF